MSEVKDIRLVVEIHNREPIELLDLTKSLVSLASQFNTYATKYGDTKENREAKLYVKEIRSGSVILELIEIATVGYLPFLENVNTIVGFATFAKTVFDYYLGKTEKKPELTTNDFKELSQIVNPIANDNGSQFNISTNVNGNLELHLHINSLEANAVQNMFERELKALKAPEVLNDTNNKMILTFYQARNDMKSNVGNKGTIEEISPKPMNIIIEDDKIKEKMLYEDNPLTTAFVVDVKQQLVKGKLVAYKVVNFHGTFDIEDASNG